MSEYTAANIKIPTAAELQEKMPWLRAHTLAKDYDQPIEFIERLLKACHISGWPVEQAIAKYLDGDKIIVTPPEMQQAHRELDLIDSRGFA